MFSQCNEENIIIKYQKHQQLAVLFLRIPPVQRFSQQIAGAKVVGMLSVFDWSEMTMKPNKGWAGREWFVVRKAEVRMAEDNTLIPHVKMGVEAREQVVTRNGLEDAAVTLPQHPLKKFADAFTRNFDLIAERKSVVFHLRELAKASVMAKYLIDSKASLDSNWYQVADDIVGATEPEAYPEIPQLWNMRGNSRIQLKDGKLVDVITGGQSNLQAIYGGVELPSLNCQVSVLFGGAESQCVVVFWLPWGFTPIPVIPKGICGPHTFLRNPWMDWHSLSISFQGLA